MATLIDLPSKPNELAAAVEELKRTLPHAIEAMQLQAKLSRAKYLALLEEGFTPAEALELCR